MSLGGGGIWAERVERKYIEIMALNKMGYEFQ